MLCAPDAMRRVASQIRGRTNSTGSEMFFGQVAPFRIEFIDKCKLPCASPTFQTAFACAGLGDRGIFFEMDEPDDAVLFGESGDYLGPMLHHAPEQVVRDADVEASGAIGEIGWASDQQFA